MNHFRDDPETAPRATEDTDPATAWTGTARWDLLVFWAAARG